MNYIRIYGNKKTLPGAAEFVKKSKCFIVCKMDRAIAG